MTYGDGDGTNYGPLVSLDVAGHEMTHGVTENSADLTYSGESGGLNEATSDIFGTMVEFYAANANDPADYLIGEEFDLKNHVGFRRMDNPASDGSSLDCWTQRRRERRRALLLGHRQPLLLPAGRGLAARRPSAASPTARPTCNGSTVTGIGRDAAAKIWYRALTVYMTSGTTYAGARTATPERRPRPLRRRIGAAEHRGRRLERRLVSDLGREPHRSGVGGVRRRRARAATTDAPTTTTRNGIRSSSAHHGEAEAQDAGVDGEGRPVGEDLDGDQRGEQRDRDQVRDPFDASGG